MAIQANSVPIRDRFGELLRTSKCMIAAELFALCALCFARLFPFSIQLFLVAFTTLSLWMRHMTWLDLGLKKSKAWWKVALLAMLAATLIVVVANVLVQPLVEQLTEKAPNTTRFDSVRGNLPMLLVWLAAVWTIVAFGEEMVFRGYLMNRIADLFGRTKAGWIASLIGSTLVFGLAHGYQGFAGIIGTAEIGLLLGIVYLLNKRNLWVNIVCHGLIDSISLVALYYSAPG